MLKRLSEVVMDIGGIISGEEARVLYVGLQKKSIFMKCNPSRVKKRII